MGPVEAVSSFFSNYANFSGRARRSEFWWSILFLWLSSGLASAISFSIGDFALAVSFLWGLVVLIPGLALCARRLHDVGLTGWLQLLFYVPIVGFIMLIVWGVADSVQANKWGPPANR